MMMVNQIIILTSDHDVIMMIMIMLVMNMMMIMKVWTLITMMTKTHFKAT